MNSMPRKNYHFFVSFIIIFLVLASSSAFGHSLKVFAQPDGDSVRGYAFFVGGGRPHGALWVAKMGEETIADGQTNNKGEYAFDLPKTIEADVKITVDARDGHVASTTLSRDRFLSLANEQKNTTHRETSSQSVLKESSKTAHSS